MIFFLKCVNVLSKLLLLSQLILLISSSLVFSQEQNNSLLNEIRRIQRDLAVLNREVFNRDRRETKNPQVNKNSPSLSSNPYVVRIEEKLEQLQSETQDNTNEREKLSNKINDISLSVKALVSDIDYRLKAIENQLRLISGPSVNKIAKGAGSGMKIAPPKMPALPTSPPIETGGPQSGGSTLGGRPGVLGTISEKDLKNLSAEKTKSDLESKIKLQQKTNVAKISLLPAGTPDEKFKYAFSLVRKADYEKASQALEQFITLYPSIPLSLNAKYWLGRTYFVQKEYREAAKNFLNAYQADPAAGRAADILLRLGISLSKLNKKNDACATFAKLERDYPKIESVLKSQLTQERARAGCA